MLRLSGQIKSPKVLKSWNLLDLKCSVCAAAKPSNLAQPALTRKSG
jgi:hypothetical protein